MKKLKAFSLIEILFALVVISVVLATLVPVMTKKIDRNAVIANADKKILSQTELDARYNRNCIIGDKDQCYFCDLNCGKTQYKNTASCTCIECLERFENCEACTEDGCSTCKEGYIEELGVCVEEQDIYIPDVPTHKVGSINILTANIGTAPGEVNIFGNDNTGITLCNADQPCSGEATTPTCWQGETATAYCGDAANPSGYSGCNRSACNWAGANKACEYLARYNYKGISTWRLPTISELDVFTNSQTNIQSARLCQRGSDYTNYSVCGDKQVCKNTTDNNCNPDFIWSSSVDIDSDGTKYYVGGLRDNEWSTNRSFRLGGTTSVRCVY